MASSFGQRLFESFERFGQLCVGIDPHAALIADWGLADSPAGLREFSMRVIDNAAGSVPAIKPQVSFFERFGAAGLEVLAEITNRAKEADLLVIADAKRGDIGTTMDAYLEAWFGEKSGLYADALTVSPYLGLGAISSGFEKWVPAGKGVYSLVATSNPEGKSVQLAKVGERTLAAEQWDSLSNLNSSGQIAYGAVIGATLRLSDYGIDSNVSNVPVLAPGFGAQGAFLTDASLIYGSLASKVLYSVSRSVLSAGPSGIREAIMKAKLELQQGLNQ